MGDHDTAKEVYKQLRKASCRQLREQMARFEQLSPAERLEQVGLVRAVGVVFAEGGSVAEQEEARSWLVGLLKDPQEKIRRYAMNALPKLGAGSREEKAVLSLLQESKIEREKTYLARALEKIGGEASLAALQQQDLAAQSEQKLKANIARAQAPGLIRSDLRMESIQGIRIYLRCRRGLEQFVVEEVKERSRANPQDAKFRFRAVRRGLVEIVPVAAFCLEEIFAFRCFATAGIFIGQIPGDPGGEGEIEQMAEAITSKLSQSVLEAFTEGQPRYRLNFVKKVPPKSTVRRLAERIYTLRPSLLNDPRNALWSIDLYGTSQGISIELRPRLAPDPRLYFRRGEIPAASHPPLAACMARLGGRRENEVVWDPFCGSGLELIERALLGGVCKVFGTDHSEHALKIARENFGAANIPLSLEATFAKCDFRDFNGVPGLGENSVTLLVTNPPLGKRIPIPNLRGLIEDLFRVADRVLKPGGRLVFANPLRMGSPIERLKLQSSSVVDFGGFDCRLEMYRKSGGA